MDEQSHKDAMRAAVRGDFERLRARRQRVPSTPAATPAGAGRIVLTPPSPAHRPPERPPAPVAEPAPAAATAPARSSWLRALRRRAG